MAKINRFLLEYQESISKVSGKIKAEEFPLPVLRRFIRLFSDIGDSRCSGMTDYPLTEILLVSFLAVLGNASTWIEIEQFGREKEGWLRQFLPLKNGTPSHDTFRRVFSLLDPAQLEEATVCFLMENISAIRKSLVPESEDGYRLICVDGKEEKGTGRKYGTSEEVRNLQTLHVYDASSGVCIVSKPIGSKTNEIPVAQEALRNMNLKGCIVTFDALHTQKETIAVISRSGGDYVGGLKENQPGLLEDARLAFSGECLKELKQAGGHYLEEVGKAHGQIERRRYYMTEASFGSSKKSDWKKLRYFVCLEKHTVNTVTKAENTEIRYYITSLDDILLCAEAIRGHWCVENNLHWHLDYSFAEDDNTTMDKKAFTNLSLINKMCLSLCKLAKPLMGNSSIRVIRKRFSWNFETNLAALLNAFNEDELKNALKKG